MILKKVKENLFLILVAAAYILIFLIRPEMGVTSIKNSGYYIKEMLMIMPAIFILTALLDMWVPKDKIMRYLGQESKGKGVVLSLVLGSISAGPIYAAFPMCVMLHKKGASIRNIVILLSSWAVIKIPMLLNEAKFLGMKFMVLRWILTIVSIIIFSWLTAKIVQDEDLPQSEKEKQEGVIINKDACMGCTVCINVYPELFEMDNKKASVVSGNFIIDKNKLEEAITSCPVNAIEYNVDEKMENLQDQPSDQPSA